MVFLAATWIYSIPLPSDALDAASGLVKVRIPFYGDYNETDPVKIAEEGGLHVTGCRLVATLRRKGSRDPTHQGRPTGRCGPFQEGKV